MTPKDRELMERYIYQVTRRLPRDQRNEVGLELQELIGDMLEEAETMEDVLTKLGNPAEFAKKYQEPTHYLIGPEYYDTYLWFVKIVLICTLVPVLAVSVIEGLREGLPVPAGIGVEAMATGVIYGITKAIGNSIISCVGAFGGVTLVFAIMERQKVKLDLKKEKEWSVGDLGDNFTGKKNVWTPRYLSPVPHKKAVISRGDSIVGIIFIVIFCVLLIFVPNIFSAVIRNGEAVSVIPVFNLERWNIILPVFALSLLIGLADEVVRLIAGCYCKMVMISSIVTGIIQLILSIIVLKVFPFWNPDFAAEIKIQLGEQLDGVERFISKWDETIVTNVILAIIFIATLLEIGTAVYKTLRYGVEKKDL
ncbi:HAAS signaling domain-containing protein [Anaerolentibacter hominis]|uniref:HAAS signaling domain-containing protein n=1 Tax=Anaerolentibacter hominis TaxID=3079009 RepID=UPI0031B86265